MTWVLLPDDIMSGTSWTMQSQIKLNTGRQSMKVLLGILKWEYCSLIWFKEDVSMLSIHKSRKSILNSVTNLHQTNDENSQK